MRALALLLMIGLLALAPALPAHADDVPFFSGPSACPIAHCNQHLDGREGMANNTGSILTLGVSTPPAPTAVATYTPPTPVAVNSSLGCTVGQPGPTATPSLVECDTTQAQTGPGSGPFVYNLTASGDAKGAGLSLNWTSAAYQSGQPTSCTDSQPFGMDKYVVEGAPLFDDEGYTYVSDDHAIAKYTPGGSGGTGTCAWATPNPDQAALISWNAIALPKRGTYAGGYFLVGQGTAGPVVLANYLDASIIVTLNLPDGQGGKYVTYNTISAVQTTTGARIYDSTADCSSGGGCDPTAHAPGALYAIDITSPTTSGGTPTIAVAWSFTFAGPSGASPMVYTPSSGAPEGDRIFFDGGGDSCTPSCPSPHPHLFELLDNCAFGDQLCSSDGGLPTLKMDQDFTLLGENGYCMIDGVSKYRGIQAAPALEGPEAGGMDPNYSVWAFAACGGTLYRFDAVSGDLWSTTGGSGAPSINVSNLPGLQGYFPGSTMETVIDSHTSDTTMFVGGQSQENATSYVLALDLETGKEFWAVPGPSAPKPDDTPFNGQFPIARTTAGGNVLIAITRGQTDGSTILAIPLS